MEEVIPVSSAFALRHELNARARQLAIESGSAHDTTAAEFPSVIFSRTRNHEHGNFHPTSYRNICADPAWSRRLAKVHTSGPKTPSAPRRWRELDCAASSDALLMNIFCYSRTLRNPALCALLAISPGERPRFGYKPRVPLHDGQLDRTEIDMKLGSLLVEAKLTESDFQTAPRRLVERYRHLLEVFDGRQLPQIGTRLAGYQLLRGVLAAHASGGAFCVFCDARRPDLIESWFSVLQAVRICNLRCRLQLVTWQEISATLPRSLRVFLGKKYGIFPAP